MSRPLRKMMISMSPKGFAGEGLLCARGVSHLTKMVRPRTIPPLFSMSALRGACREVPVLMSVRRAGLCPRQQVVLAESARLLIRVMLLAVRLSA